MTTVLIITLLTVLAFELNEIRRDINNSQNDKDNETI